MKNEDEIERNCLNRIQPFDVVVPIIFRVTGHEMHLARFLGRFLNVRVASMLDADALAWLPWWKKGLKGAGALVIIGRNEAMAHRMLEAVLSSTPKTYEVKN